MNNLLIRFAPVILIVTLALSSCKEHVAVKLNGEGTYQFWRTSQKNEDGLPLYYYFDKNGRFLVFGKWYDSGFLLRYASPLNSKGWYMINADSVCIKSKNYAIKQLDENCIQILSKDVSDTLYVVEKDMIPNNFDMLWVIEGQEYEF